MKSSAASFVVLIAACAISAGAGFWFGQVRQPDSTSGPAAASANGRSGSRDITIVDGQAVGNRSNLSISDFLKGTGKADPGLLALWASGLSPADCINALADLKTLPGGIQRDTIMEAVLKSWAAKDPQGLLSNSNTIGVPRLREIGIDGALKAWATKDPQAALQWIKDNPGSASTAAFQDRYAAAIAGFAANDPRGAFDVVMALSDTNIHDRQLKQDAFKALTDALAEQGRFSDAVKMFADLPTGAVRDDAFNRLATQWAATNPKDAATWVISLTDQSQRNQLGGKVADAWAATDPVAAATWAAQVDSEFAKADNGDTANGVSRNDRSGVLLANAILSWAKYDLNAPGEFLNELPASPTKDRGVAIFAMRSAAEDPEGALKWVGSISDEGMRQTVIMPIAIQMYQQDPNNFDAFLNSTDLIKDDAKAQLKQTAPMIGASMAMLNTMTGGTGGGDMMTRIMESALTADPTALQNSMGPLGAAMRGRRGQPGGAPAPQPAQ